MPEQQRQEPSPTSTASVEGSVQRNAERAKKKTNSGIVEAQLKGNTLRVYVYVVTHRKCGVREIQRALHFSSSSLAQYHLSKLADLGLLSETGGEYFLTEEIRVDVLKDFLKLGSLIVPRFVFYGVFFTIITTFLSFIILFQEPGPTIDFWFAGLLLFACVIFWYEALRAWIRGPV